MYNNKKTQKFQFVSLLSVGWLILLLIGCDSSINTIESQISDSINTIDYELYDGKFIELIIDPNYIHESLKFDTMEEYDDYGIGLEKNESITLNSALWDKLSHAYDPIEIHMFDMDTSVMVDGIKYIAEKEALYSININNENTGRTMEVYYGESGDEDLAEIERIFVSLIEPDILLKSDLKNPESKTLYEELHSSLRQAKKGLSINKVSSIKEAKAIFQDHDCNAGSSSCDTALIMYLDSSNNPYIFKGRLSANGSVQEAEIGHMLWNQSHRSGIRARAKGGTITVIDRFDGLGVRAITFNEGAGGVPLWTYHENGSLDLSIPYSYVQVV